MGVTVPGRWLARELLLSLERPCPPGYSSPLAVTPDGAHRVSRSIASAMARIPASLGCTPSPLL